MRGRICSTISILSLLVLAAGPFALALGLAGCAMPPVASTPVGIDLPITPLPPPRLDGSQSLEELLTRRRSTREFASRSLTEAEVGQLLWAAQGLTHERGFRTAPSAGALYPLEMYVATAQGVFHYDPTTHRLLVVGEDDARQQLYQAALNQEPVRQAPAVFIVTAVYGRTAKKYGEQRSPRYVHLEAGHAAQNLLLEAVSLGLGAVPIGAFHDSEVQQALGLPADHEPLYLIPAGPLQDTE